MLAGLVVAPSAYAAFDNNTPRGTFAGTHNYVVTGNTLRRYPNDGTTNTNECQVLNGSSATLSGIPAGSTITAAYLYWAGSGPTPDASVTFQRSGGSAQSFGADQTFTDNFQTDLNNQHYDLDYFAGFKDVTSQVTGNGTYTFSNLAVATTDNYGGDADADYCGPAAVIAGWSLVVVYSNPAERYRYTRVYDGLQFFRGSSVTTTQSGFRVPDLVDGKVTVVTWEGDPDANSSQALDGFTESLKFEGHSLLNAGCDAADNLYNSSIGGPGVTCNTNAYGVDIDTYDVTPYLYEGQTGATLDYSSGNDLVFLTAQVISTTNTPVADLGITKAHVGSFFTVGQDGSYSIVVHNFGPEVATGTATVTDTLPTGLSFVSGTGPGWTCSAVGQDVTCNNSAPTIAIGADLPTLTLTVAVGADAAASTVNTATVSHPMFDGTGGNQSSTDTVAVHGSSLATSTKTVADLNGGSVEAGDTLRYTITLKETGAYGIDATGVSVVDDLAANLGNLSIVAIPAGATDGSVGTGGANDTGQVYVSGITVPSGTTRTVVFDATVSTDAGPGDTIDNSAIVTNGSGPGATPSAPTQTIPDPAPPVSGNKLLYLLMGTPDDDHALTRARPTGAATMTWNRTNDEQYQYFYLPPLAKPLVLGDNTVTVALRGRRSGNSATRRARAQFFLNGTGFGNSISGNSGNMDFNVAGYTTRTANVDLSTTSFAAGDQLIVRVENRDTRDIQLTQLDGANYSTVTLAATTVVNVDSVGFFSAQYPATTTRDIWEPGDIVYIRADVSDPFGGFDVSAANSTLALADADGGPPILAGATLVARTNPVEGDGVPNRILEYAYTIPASPSFGDWTATVTGSEGAENTITHSRAGSFTVAPKALNVVKSHAGDFTAGASNSYTLTVNNTGGTTVTGTTTVKDTLATGLAFVSGTGTGWTCSAAGQLVTCTSTASIGAGASMAPITLVVSVAGNMGDSVENRASVGNSTIGGGVLKPGNTDTAIIRHPDLSTSTKSVRDLDGGDANPGDTLRYTITVIESAGYPANAVTVSDMLPSSLEGLTGLNASLSTCNGTPSVAGQVLTVTGLSLAGGASCKLVFDVQVSASAGAGLAIDNVAGISNPNGPGADPAAPTVTVSQSQVVVPSGKVLYAYANNTLTRVPQAAAGTNTINEGSYQDFLLGAVANPLVIAPGSTVSIDLWLQRSGNTTTQGRTVHATLFKNGTTQVGSISNPVSFTSTTPARQNFTITAPSFGSAGSLDPGDTLVLRVYNDSGTGGTPRTVGFSQRVTGGATDDDLSTVTISTTTVVHVDSLEVYSAPYPATTQASSYGQGDTIYVRATASDPFGFADVSGGSIAIKGPGGTTFATATLDNATHTVGTPSGATRTWEYAYTIPASPPVGAWTASVTANEGSEGTITHTGNGGFSVGGRVTLRATWGTGATAGDTVALTIAGGTGAVAGSSTAPSTLVAATSNAATGATITLAEGFGNGLPGEYTITLACEKDSDHTTVTPSGTGLSRTITMPAGSVTCTWSNDRTVPLTVVKLATVRSDPVNGSVHPKAIPGAIVGYQIIVTNPAATAADADSIVVVDPIPDHVDLRVADIGVAGSGPVVFLDGSPSSGLAYSFVSLADTDDDVSFSSDHGATWTYVPTPDAGGVDPAVTGIRINPKGSFAPGNAQFTIKFRVRIE